MKIALLSLAATLFVGTLAQAAAVFGAIVVHELDCTVPKRNGQMVLGAGYSMKCQTRALAPEESVIGCQLIEQVVSPTAEPKDVPLTQVSQTASKAEYSGSGVQITLNKKTMTATLDFASGAVSTCSEVSPK